MLGDSWRRVLSKGGIQKEMVWTERPDEGISNPRLRSIKLLFS